MSTQRTKRYVGQVQQILLYRSGRGAYSPAEQMMAVPREPTATGQFFFDGKIVHFHDDDVKREKFIVYESVEQVQRTTRRSKKVRLMP